MKTLKQLASQIDSMQSEYREISSRNNGVICGAIDTSALGNKILSALREYNSTAKRTAYVGGQLVSTRADK